MVKAGLRRGANLPYLKDILLLPRLKDNPTANIALGKPKRLGLGEKNKELPDMTWCFRWRTTFDGWSNINK